MWTTLDDLTLSIAPAALRRLATRHRVSGLTDLVRRTYRGSLLPAVRRAVGQLARSAYLSGRIRSRSGRRYPTFIAQIGGRSFRLVARPLGGNHYTIVGVRPVWSSAEYSDSYGHRVVQNLIIDELLAQGAQLATDQSPPDEGIRDNRRQVAGLRGTPRPNSGPNAPKYNVPDISYVTPGNRRVNIEIDTVSDNNDEHLRQLGHGDPGGIHIGYVVDARGEILSRRIYDPSRSDKIGPLPLAQNILVLPPRVAHGQAGRSQIPPRPSVSVQSLAAILRAASGQRQMRRTVIPDRSRGSARMTRRAARLGRSRLRGGMPARGRAGARRLWRYSPYRRRP